MYLDNFLRTFRNSLTSVIGALITLFLGWLFAKEVSTFVEEN